MCEKAGLRWLRNGVPRTSASTSSSSELGVPSVLRKGGYHQLVPFLEPHEVDPEAVEVLDGIVAQVALARPEG